MSHAPAIFAFGGTARTGASAASSANSGWYLRDLAGAADAWSPEVFALYGFEPGEVVPAPDVVYRQLQAEDAGRIAKEISQATSDKRCFDLHYNIQRRTGETLSLRNRGQVILIGGNSFVIGIVSEVTRDQDTLASLEETAVMSPAGFSEPTTPPIRLLASSSSKRSGLSPRQVRRVNELMRKNLGDRLSVEQMAQAAGVSCAYFARTFKIATGETPHRFLLNLRLAKAREALLTPSPRGNLSLLAADLGFFDQAHLTKYFRKKYGHTPGEFLRLNHSAIEAIRIT